MPTVAPWRASPPLRTATAALGLIALGLAGCEAKPTAPAKGSAAPTAPTSAAPTTTAPGSTAPAAPAPPPPVAAPPPPTAAAAATTRPGPAYIGVDRAGLYRLDGGVLTRIIDHRFPFQHLIVDGHGVVYAAAIGGLWRIAGDDIRRLDDPNSPPMELLAIGPDGVLWASERQNLHRWDGAWTREPGATFDGALLSGVAVDLDGRVWVATIDALWRLDGDRWHRLDHAFAGKARPFFETLTAGPDGAIYLSGLAGTFVFRAGRWTDAGLAIDTGSVAAIVAGAGGHVVASGGVDQLVIATPGQPRRRQAIAGGGAQARRGEVAAVDATGRSWIRTENGLVILDAAGQLVQQWTPGTVAGVTGKITAVAVVDAGPTLPRLRAAATGRVTGKVVQAGKIIGNARVELCESPLTVFRTSPCDGATFSRTTRTAADGSFQLDDVPIGSYGFAVDPGAGWIILFGGSACCTALEPGGSYDIGALGLK